MKIIHCADIHADSKMDTHFSKDQASLRRKEIADTFSRMVNLAKKNGVEVVIIAGDLFDTNTKQQREIKKRISYTISQYPEIDFLYLRGNHDNDVDFGSGDELKNLKTFSKDGWSQFRYGNIVISGREFDEKIPLSAYGELSLNEDDVNIVVLHGQVADYESKDGAPVISLPKLQGKNIDYLAMGHIHSHREEKLDGRGKWCYPGCLEGRGFDECGEKGAVVLNIDETRIGEKIETKFVPFAMRKIHDVEVKLSGVMSYNEILNRVTKTLSEKGISSNDIVQVVLKGEIDEETEIECESFQNALSQNYFYIRFKDKSEMKIDFKKYENDVSLKGEFIRLVKDQKDITDEEKTKIIMTGIKALAGRL